MKKLSIMFVAVVLAFLTATLLPVQVFADTPDYVSEIKVGMGSNAEMAKASLSDYTVIDVDVNKNAGGGAGSKGEKAVYIGYKTTKNRKEAITDIALMNMKGGYDLISYELLMEQQMKSQIIPFVDNFLAAVKEYRTNFNSKNKANRERAAYIHEILNKFTDDDCGGKGLGDLLLNETKYEMGDERYNKLSDEEKKNHADILTIIAQSNGKATLAVENLLTRASDSADNTWIDRLKDTTYDSLIDATGKSPTDARKEIAKKYDDDANTVLEMWDDLSEPMNNIEKISEAVENYDSEAYKEAAEAYGSIDENMSEEEIEEISKAYFEAEEKMLEMMKNVRLIGIHETLQKYEYGDSTLLDFFSQTSEKIEEDITVLYPLVASLSDGQRAGLKFTNLAEMCSIAMTDEKGYNDVELDKIEKASIYEGIDRTIYQKGGVALTSESLRKDAMSELSENSGSSIGALSISLIVLSCASVVAFAGSAVMWGKYASKLKGINKNINMEYIEMLEGYGYSEAKASSFANRSSSPYVQEKAIMLGKNNLCRNLAIGLGVAMVVLTILSIHFTWRDMKARYKVDYTPIPKYIIDEKDLIGFNSKGEKVVLKNQSAYYRAAECNRAENAEYFKSVGTFSDLNGDVGPQWLCLYTAKNEAEEPILASSIKAVTNSDEIPSGYSTGIHMFGSETAFNLNSSLYVWNKSAPSVMIYFKRDEGTPAKTTGTAITGGTIAMSLGGGILLGAVFSAFIMNAYRKRRENRTLTA